MERVPLLVAALVTFVFPGVAALGQFVVKKATQEVTISSSVSIDGQPDEAITTILADPAFPGALGRQQLRRGHVLVEAGTSIGI